MRGKSLTCRQQTDEEAQVFDLSIDKIGSKTLKERIDSNGKSETCRASERQSRKLTAQTILDFPFPSQSPATGKSGDSTPAIKPIGQISLTIEHIFC